MSKFWLLLLTLPLCSCSLFEAPRPNILWITSEDNGPHLGAYGDGYATTPQLDALAAKGMIYLHAWSNAPVCAPARTAIISGMYPPSTGSQHMRSMTRLPEGMKMFPQYLREAGYYTTNNRKEDYNLEKPGQVWDESSETAHWKNRAPDQPFFAVFNLTVTHESQIRKRPHEAVHDPAKVRLPAYHPDAPEVRQDWAQYYDKITEMDALVGESLRELEEAGLAEGTIVFYYGDHGSGMPRSKRWPYNSGLHVPLIVYIPEKFAHLRAAGYAAGGTSGRMVSFVDLAPTVLSLAGIEPPAHMQGAAFAGKFEAEPREYLHGFRGRMDERYDMVRSVRGERYLYVRNYMPHEIYGQHVAYMFQTPTTRVWKQLFDAGKLNAEQSRFWQTKPPEELYDLEVDPDEVRNLAASPEHREVVERLRAALREHALRIRDLGFLPEEEIHTRSSSGTPYDYGHSPSYALERIMEVAEAASSLDGEDTPKLIEALGSADSAERYWGAMGLLMRGEPAVRQASALLRDALKDESPSVQVIAARCLAEFGDRGGLEASLAVLIARADVRKNGVFIATLALNAIDKLDGKAVPLKAQIEALPKITPSVHRRMDIFVPDLVKKALADLGS